MRLGIWKKCIGCKRITQERGINVCEAYEFPRMKWRLGNCPLASHVLTTSKVLTPKQRIGQQKQRGGK